MRETQRNIKKYKKALVDVKEKIFATGLLFIVSLAMLTTTSFAWIVLSTAPQVSNIQSTIVGNGNLEIALAGSDENGGLVQPGSSNVGDSKLDLVNRNKTWGNLINLNDPSYGLGAISLKPAELYDDDLLNSPLTAVEYDSDGRVISKLKDFAYSNFDAKADNGKGAFVIKDTLSYGVRAISSVKSETLQDADDIAKIKYINESLEQAQKKYEILVSTDTKVNSNGYIKVVSDLIGVYLTDRFNDGDENYGSYMKTMYALMSDFREVLYLAAGTYGYIANVQLMENNPKQLPAFTVETLMQTDEKTLKSNGVELMTGFDALKSDITTLETHMETIKTLRDEYEAKTRSKVIWSDISKAVNFIVNIDKCIVSIPNANMQYYVNQVGRDEAMSLVSNSKKGTFGIITEGALKRAEQLIGKKMYAEKLTITATYIITLDIENVTVYTDAKAPFTINKLIDNVEVLLSGGNKVEVAGDVYGLALDFWLRTNIPDSYLTLEGKAHIQLEAQKTSKGYIMYKTKDGYLIYHQPSGSVSDPSSELLSDLKSGNKKFENYNSHLLTGDLYYYSTGTKMEFIDPETGEESASVKETFVREQITGYAINTQVVGYDGVNRVWQEGVETEDSATQGQGSCYIFYSEDPLYEKQMLRLLKSFTVVFISEDGTKLATAKLNTDNAYSKLGKVIVPLELDDKAITIQNDKGEDVKIVASLQDSIPTLMTAIVYIDGTMVNNDDVDAINDINGYLNFQFGSTSTLNNFEDENLKSDVVKVSAHADITSFEFKDGVLPTTPLTVNVQGISPSVVQARFMRMLNNSQVALEDFITLNPQEDGSFKTNAVFNRPGTYVLRTVWLDGIEYELDAPITITITGFAIDSVVWGLGENEVYKMVSDKSLNTYIDLGFSGTYVPETVQGVFKTSSDENITIDFRRTSGGRWTSNVSLTESTKYVFDTLIIDGEVEILPASMVKEVTLHLGVHARVDIIGDTTVTYDPTKTYTYGMNVTILDDDNKPMSNLSNVELLYTSQSVLDIKPVKLKWNSGSQKYTGNLNLNFPGIYSFDNITINGSRIDNGTGSNITIIPPEEPKYVDNSVINLNSTYQYKPDRNATIELDIENTTSARVAAVLKNLETGTTQIVEGSRVLGDRWLFNIPQLTNRGQNGNWKVEALYLTNIFYNGEPYIMQGNNWSTPGQGAQNHITWYMSDFGDDINVKVVNELKVSVTHNGHNEFTPYGSDETSKVFSGVFTDSIEGKYSISGYKVTITDYDGQPLNPEQVKVSNIKLTYNHANTPTWWANSGNVIDKTLENPTINITNNNGVFTLDKDTLTFYYAGDYTPELTMTIGDNNTTTTIRKAGSDVKGVVVENFISSEKVEWSRVDAKFTSLNPAVGTGINVCTADGGWFKAPKYTTKYNAIDTANNSIKAYVAGEKVDYKVYQYNRYKTFTQATITLENGGNFTSATTTLTKTNADNSPKFTFTNGAKTAQAQIGANGGGTGNDKLLSAAGTSASTIDVTVNGKTYTFTLSVSLKVAENQ